MEPLARLVDASANRAREALRVLEDLARFALDDADLTERLKRLRHALRAELAALPLRPLDLLDARDTPGDVGTAITTAAELDRSRGLTDIAAAAAKRLQEALRSLEEASKALARDAKGFESARYAAYDLERALLLRLAPTCPQWTLCVLVTRALCTHHDAGEVVRLAVAGGADAVQIREKDLPDAERLDHTARLVRLCRELGVHSVVNDRPDIARLTDADAVHLGQTDLPVAAARSVVGPGRWIGVSCSTPDHARKALEDGADTLGLGPIFPSTTKHKPALSGPDLIRAVTSDPHTARLPHLAISGITPANAADAARAGARGVAVSAAICSAQDPRAAARAIADALRSHATIAP